MTITIQKFVQGDGKIGIGLWKTIDIDDLPLDFDVAGDRADFELVKKALDLHCYSSLSGDFFRIGEGSIKNMEYIHYAPEKAIENFGSPYTYAFTTKEGMMVLYDLVPEMLLRHDCPEPHFHPKDYRILIFDYSHVATWNNTEIGSLLSISQRIYERGYRVVLENGYILIESVL